MGKRRKYFITGSWSDWRFEEMTTEVGAEHVYHFKLRGINFEQLLAFQICADEDRGQTLHPEMALADQGISPMLGPDAKGEGLHWAVHVTPNSKVDIKLDLSEKDKRKRV